MRLIDADAIPYELWTTEVEVDKTRDNGTYHYYQNRFMVDRRDIAAMPTIEEKRKGEWREAPYVKNAGVPYYWYLRCSECGYKIYDDVNYNYCPHCGADMGGDGRE